MQVAMAMCDEPGCRKTGSTVLEYEIAYPDGRIVVDLCKTHAKPLMALRTHYATRLHPARPQRSRRAVKVADPDEMPPP